MKTILSLALTSLCAATAMAEEAANLALVAQPSTSYISGDTSLTALNDGIEPQHSDFRNDGCYGNWPMKETQWVQYEWDKPVSTDAIDVYWWDDHQGVRLPSAARLLVWNGEAFVPVKTKEKLGVEVDRYNTLKFDEITTTNCVLSSMAQAIFPPAFWNGGGSIPAARPRLRPR